MDQDIAAETGFRERVMKDMRYGEEYLKNHPFDER